MKRLDLIIAHECLIEVNEILHKHKVGGMTFYDIKGRGRTKYEPIGQAGAECDMFLSSDLGQK